MAGVKIKGLEGFEKRIDEMAKRTKNQAPAYKVIKQQALADILRHFSNESAPEGKWKPSQRVIKNGGKTLQDTGRLRGATKGGVLPDRVVIMNNVNYASYNDKTRKFMWISDKAITLMTKTMIRFILEGK